MSNSDLTLYWNTFFTLPAGCLIMILLWVFITAGLFMVISAMTDELEPYRKREEREKAAHQEKIRKAEIIAAAKVLIESGEMIPGVEKPKRIELTDDGELVEPLELENESGYVNQSS